MPYIKNSGAPREERAQGEDYQQLREELPLTALYIWWFPVLRINSQRVPLLESAMVTVTVGVLSPDQGTEQEVVLLAL